MILLKTFTDFENNDKLTGMFLYFVFTWHGLISMRGERHMLLLYIVILSKKVIKINIGLFLTIFLFTKNWETILSYNAWSIMATLYHRVTCFLMLKLFAEMSTLLSAQISIYMFSQPIQMCIEHRQWVFPPEILRDINSWLNWSFIRNIPFSHLCKITYSTRYYVS